MDPSIPQARTATRWYHYAACFLAGVFLTNAAPHFIHGIEGEHFPTPFANPPGTGLSSAPVNVLWAMANLLIGYGLLRVGRVSSTNKLTVALLFAGVVGLSLMFSFLAPTALVNVRKP